MFIRTTFWFICFHIIQQVNASCDVFNTISTPDDPVRTVELDLSDQPQKDYGWGVWTKYSQQYESLDNVALQTQAMNVATEFLDSNVYMTYYIIFDKVNKIMFHRLYIQHDFNLQVREMQLNYNLLEEKWVFFYFCYQQATQNYNLFLYVNQDNINVQMVSGGPYVLENDQVKYYNLSGTQQISVSYDTGITQSLLQFAGQISDLDQRIGSAYYYPDIPTFLANINDPCDPVVCLAKNSTVLVSLYDFTNGLITTKLKYIKNKFMLYGWVQLNALTEATTISSVLFRATFWKQYLQDTNQGDKALYWEYLQSTTNDAENGFKFTTYHDSPNSYGSYETQFSDSWVVYGAYYAKAIKFWHWFVYQEGVDGPQNLRLTIYYGFDGKTKTYQMTQNHFDKAKLYFTIGGDIYNNNFKGQIRDLTFDYCESTDDLAIRTCDRTCQTCFGPLDNHCITCQDSATTNRNLVDGKCACENNFVDTGDLNCQPKQALLKNINIQEQEIIDQSGNCQIGEFYVYENESYQCLKCPGAITSQGFYCLDCIINPTTWYQNPICKTDYLQPKNDANVLYVFLQKDRIEINYEYYLLIKQQTETMSLELCSGCLGKTDSLINSIQRFSFDNIYRFACKTCYQAVDGNCVNFNEHCNSCDSHFQCTQCETNYTNYNFQCLKCPLECPNCTYNSTDFLCNSCINGYYLNSTLQSCQQCGQFCRYCLYHQTLDFLQCVRCIDDYDYFISADLVHCRAKNLPNCAIQGEEYFASDVNGTQGPQPYITSMDIKLKLRVLPTFSYCLKCNDQYITTLVYPQKASNGDYLVSPLFGCLSPNDPHFINLPQELANKVLTSTSDTFQLAYTKAMVSPFQEQFTILLGDTVTTSTNTIYQSIITLSTTNNPQCTLKDCNQCIKNYVWSQEFCMQCAKEKYANVQTGICYNCPVECSECIHQNIQYQDGWKWEVRGFYHFRSKQLFYGFHNFHIYAVTTSTDDYEIICTVCKNGTLFENKCYPICPCDSCMYENGQTICLTCPNQLQTFVNGQCVECPTFCALCRQLDSSEIKKINPYFDPVDQTMSKYAKQCLKQVVTPPPSGKIYHDVSLGLEVNCKNSNLNDCYLYLEIPLNVYCESSFFKQDQDSLPTQQDKIDFMAGNILLDTIFSTSSLSHFYQIESSYLYDELNSKTVKLVRLILNIKDGTGVCSIKSNTFVTQTFRKNVFSIYYLELVFNSQPNVPINFGQNITFYQFTKITFQNVLIDSLDNDASINIQNEIGVEVMIDSLTIKNANNLNFFFLIQNPLKITLQNTQIQNSQINGLQGIVQYYFSNPLSKQFTIQIQNLFIQSSIIKNSQLIVQKLDTSYSNQILIATNVQSTSNQYSNSSIFYTNFLNQIRASSFQIDQFTSYQDTLIRSTYCTLHGALLVQISNSQIKNSIFQSTVKLFKIPLSIISGILVQDNNFQSLDNTVFTNVIDSLYADNIQTNVITFQNMQFISNTYVGNKVFMEMVSSSNFQNLIVQLDQITLHSNKIVKASETQQIISQNASLYFDLKELKLTNFVIIRGFTLPEISVNNADKLTILQMDVSMNSFYRIKLLHSQLSCATNISSIGYTSFLQIYNIKKVDITELVLKNLISINLPLLIIKSLARTNYRQQENFTFSNCEFTNNTLVITKLAEQQGVVSIVSEQEQYILFQSVIFKRNHQHCYQQDLLFKQSSTLLISNPYSSMQLIDSQFSSNLITNNQGANLVLIVSQVTLQNVVFSQQNILIYDNIKENLIWGYSIDEQAYLENLQSVFQIQSKGGNAFISSDITLISNVVCQGSVGLQGGAFYLQTVSSGSITIENSQFNNSKASLNSDEKGQGGAFYVDASQASLQLSMTNITISNSFSRKEGGALYLEPSRYTNEITLTYITFTESYSLTNSLIKLPISFSSQTLTLQFDMENCYASNSYGGYLNFIGLIDNIQESEIKSLNQIYLISIERGNISLTNNIFENIFHFGILELLNPNNVKVYSCLFQNVSLISESLINIQQNPKYISNQYYQDVQIKQIIQFVGSISQPKVALTELPSYTYKCDDTYQLPGQLYQLFDTTKQYIRALYNFYTIFSAQYKPSFIFGVDSISDSHLFSLKDLYFESLNCSACEDGLFKFTNIAQVEGQNLIYFNSLDMRGNQCGQLSCVVFSSTNIAKIDVISGKRLLNEIDTEFQNLVQPIKIESSSFESNSANYGGAILISKIGAIILSSSFINNQANTAGGAVYFDQDGNETMIIYDSFFGNNTAQVGGGLYLGDYSIDQPKKLNNKFQYNKASFYGDDQADQPIQLSIKIRDQILDTERIVDNELNVTDQVVIGQYSLGNTTETFLKVPSGQPFGEYQIFNEANQTFVSYDLRFRIIPLNLRKSQIKSLKGSKCNITGRQIIDNNIGEFDTNYTSLQTVTYNTTSEDYNLDSMMIYFDPAYSSTGYLQLEFQCDSIKIPLFSDTPPYDFLDYQYNYRLRINVKTFECQRGEYSSDKGTCKVCDSSADQYTVIAGQRCSIKDQIKMEKVTAARVMLRAGYWRPFESSQTIEYCLNMPENCVGGWDPGNSLCSSAHVGALCEQCDIYNVRGTGQFSVSTQYKCGSCKDIGDNTMKITLISVWTMISIFLSVKGTVETVEKMVTQYKFAKFKIFAQDPKAGYGSVLIKVMTNYLQIIGAVATFQLQLPSGLQTTVRSVGNPVEAMSFSLDCFLVNLVDINIIYFRMIWALIMPIIYMVAFLTIYCIAVLVRLTKPNKSAVTTTLIYLFTYLQPTLLEGFIALLSFRIISDIYWVQGNVAYRYDTQQHIKWIITFVFPSTLSLSLIIPAYMFISLYKQRFQLDQESTRKSWGYLYNEYQIKAYFWEIVKIFQKGFMIIFLTFYEDLIIIKGALIFMIIFVYQLLTKQFRPYKLPFLNLIDELSTIICGTSIVMGMTIYQASQSNNQEIVWPFYILLIFINGVFILIIIWEIVQAQLEDQQENLDKLRDKINAKYPDIQNKNWLLKKLFTNRGQQQRRVKQRFQMIRKYLMNIVRENPNLYSLPKPKDGLPLETEENQVQNYEKNIAKVFPTDKYQQLDSNIQLAQ